MKIVVLYDGAADDEAASADVRGVIEAVDAVEQGLAERGHETLRLPVTADDPLWPERVRRAAADVVFNLCEGITGDASREAEVALRLEQAGLRFTGSPAAALERCRRKDAANRMLAAADVPVPEWAIVDAAFDADAWPHFPAIVKPAGQDASIGISGDSVVADPAGLRRALHDAAPHAPLLVQRYVEGRELNAAVVAGVPLPVAEIEFAASAAGPRIVSYAAKWDYGSDDDLATLPRCPAPLDAQSARRVQEIAAAAVEALGVRGYARVDLRLDQAGRPWVLEVNPNPDLAPGAGLTRMAAAAGWDHAELAARVLEAALDAAAAEASVEEARAVDARRTSTAPSVIELRPLLPVHRRAIETLVRDTGVFRESEVLVALDVVDSYFTNPGQDYTALGAFTREGSLLGYVCYGPTPGAEGTFDLYWIAVSPTAQGRGVGTLLLQEVERRLAQQHARLVIIETSGTPPYEPTRGFYRARGYHEVARVPDFYADGDDRVILAKRMQTIEREG